MPSSCKNCTTKLGYWTFGFPLYHFQGSTNLCFEMVIKDGKLILCIYRKVRRYEISSANWSEHFFTFSRLVGTGIGDDGFTYRVEHVLDKCHQRHKFNKSAFWNVISTEIFAEVIRWLLYGSTETNGNTLLSGSRCDCLGLDVTCSPPRLKAKWFGETDWV